MVVTPVRSGKVVPTGDLPATRTAKGRYQISQCAVGLPVRLGIPFGECRERLGLA